MKFLTSISSLNRSRHPLPPSLVSKFAQAVQEQFFMHHISHSLSSILLFNPDTSFARDSLATDERLNALEEEVWLLWAASRKYNFDLHVLESKAQYAKDRPETVASQAQKMADIVTEQWIQIQRLEQALHITQVSFFCLKLASGSLFAKFISFSD
ncbi:unnamed protein product, partial [Prunus brigantina]